MNKLCFGEPASTDLSWCSHTDNLILPTMLSEDSGIIVNQKSLAKS